MQKISFSLHQYDLAMGNLIGEAKTGLDKTDEILGQIQVHRVVHGGITRQVSEPQIVDTEMKHHKAELLLHFDVYLKTDVEQFIEFIYEMWEAFASQAKKALFETVGLTTEAVGNSHALAGRNIWDAQLEVMESLEWHFDEEGNHNYQFYCHPDVGKKLAENPPTPEQDKKLEELISRKREEYYAKKRTRRLS
jgi:hypothetical protein